MSLKLGLRDRKKIEAKQALYEAAIALFREKGFEATSVDEIAERAGFSRATYFNYFGTKQGVLRHYGEHLQEQLQQLLDDADSEASPPLERIRQLLRMMAGEAERQREDVKLVMFHSLNDPEYLARPTPARMRVFEMFDQLVAEAQRQGEVRRDLTSQEIAMHILSLYQSLVWVIVSGRSAELTMKSAWHFIMDGVRNGDRLAR